VESCGHSPDFDYKGETCEPQSALAIGVRPMILWPLITMSNLGAWLCLDVIKSRCYSLQLDLLLSLSCYKLVYPYFSYTC
jgi:hypothetical protein